MYLVDKEIINDIKKIEIHLITLGWNFLTKEKDSGLC